MSDDAQRYPVGSFRYAGAMDDAQRAAAIVAIGETPERLRAAVSGLSPVQLGTPYREGGWTVRQVVHHVPDSHMNAYTRFKLAVTEDRPTIKPYDEAQWAELADGRDAPIEPSLTLLTALHERWVLFLRSMPAPAWSRMFLHPERGEMTVDELLALYAWHGRHHVAHITSLRERMRW
jgi:uncharacterized damage-inducible protein DinB